MQKRASASHLHHDSNYAYDRPMQRKSFGDMPCPIARSLERVGEWWSILILRDAFAGMTRFDEFQKSLGIAPNMLTRRLAALVEAGMLERRRYSERPPRHEYVLTERGRDFRPVLMALLTWGNSTSRPKARAWCSSTRDRRGRRADPGRSRPAGRSPTPPTGTPPAPPPARGCKKRLGTPQQASQPPQTGIATGRHVGRQRASAGRIAPTSQIIGPAAMKLDPPQANRRR